MAVKLSEYEALKAEKECAIAHVAKLNHQLQELACRNDELETENKRLVADCTLLQHERDVAVSNATVYKYCFDSVVGNGGSHGPVR